MALDFNALAASLKGVVDRLPKAELEKAATKAATQLKGAVSTSAGTDITDPPPGIKSLSVSVDFAELEKIAEGLEATMKPIAEQLEADLAPIARDIQDQINTAPTPGQLQAGLPGVTDKIEKKVASTTNLSTLTGKPVKATGFLKANITATSPEGIRESLLGIGENIKADEIKAAMEEVLTPSVKQELADAGSSVFEVTKKATGGILESLKSGDLSGAFKKVTAASADISRSGAVGKLQGIMENIGGGLSGPIKGIVPTISVGPLREVISSFTSGDVTSAVAKISEVDPTVDLGDAESKIKSIDPTVAGLTTDNIPEPVSLPETVVVGDTASQFTYITSEEELQVELANITREITEVIIDWTYQVPRDGYTADLIEKRTQTKLGTPIQYHYVITPSGGLQRGRPIETLADRILQAGPEHNKYSIYLGIVGGLESVSPIKESGSAYTDDQFISLNKFLSKFYQVYPNGQVFGRDEIDKGVGVSLVGLTPAGPGFDISAYILRKFAKENILPPQQPSKTNQELLDLQRARTQRAAAQTGDAVVYTQAPPSKEEKIADLEKQADAYQQRADRGKAQIAAAKERGNQSPEKIKKAEDKVAQLEASAAKFRAEAAKLRAEAN